jgi:hypothetical protein
MHPSSQGPSGIFTLEVKLIGLKDVTHDQLDQTRTHTIAVMQQTYRKCVCDVDYIHLAEVTNLWETVNT